MANTYVIGGPGDASGANAANGGGWTEGYDATYANTMGTNGAPIISLSSCTVVQGGIGQIRIGYLGGFTTAEIGQLVNIDFADTYTDGRYMITGVDASGNYIEVTATYTSDTTATTVKVGGALDKLETVDGLLASGDTLLIPNGSSSQRTYTETNTCTIASASAGATINIIGVNLSGQHGR